MKARVALASTLALFVFAAVGHGEASDRQFVSVRKCGTCHSKERIGGQSGVWKASAHAQAFKSLGSDRAAELGRKAGLETSPQKSAACLRCHVTGYGLPAARFPRGRAFLKDGVGCESCHGAGRSYRKKKVMSDPELARARGLIEPSEALCTECHNPESPTWDPNRYARADGSRAGFDFETAAERIAHPIPSDVKGRYLEILKQEKGG